VQHNAELHHEGEKQLTDSHHRFRSRHWSCSGPGFNQGPGPSVAVRKKISCSCSFIAIVISRHLLRAPEGSDLLSFLVFYVSTVSH
jgi:hypothetical protein